MRARYTQIFKDFFHQKLFRSRIDLGLTQEAMAQRLLMASRTYVDLDHGKTGCSALTLALYLIYICPNAAEFLDELREALEGNENKVA